MVDGGWIDRGWMMLDQIWIGLGVILGLEIDLLGWIVD